ncbi:MAG TPA: hypothetical protein ENN17_02830 [bacterium]|nr:hypothetical protein [bacterium]
MKISITKQEYRRLLDVLMIADWVMDSYHVEPPEETRSYRELAQKIYALAGENGCGNLIEYDTALDEFFPTDEYDLEGEWRVLMDAFEEQNFWDELTDRLALRDVVLEVGYDHFRKMDSVDRLMKLEQASEKYAREFEENGIENIRIAGLEWGQVKKKE